MKRLAIAILALTCTAAARAGNLETITPEFKTEGIETLSMRTINADVNFMAAEKTFSITITNFDKESCVFTETKNGAELRLELKPVENAARNTILSWFTGHAKSKNCMANISIALPKKMRVNTNTVSGDVKLAAVAGDINIQTVSGEISLSDAGGASQLNTTSGDISGTTSAPTKASTVSGDVTLRWLAAPKGSLEFSSVSGDTHLTFPRGTGMSVSRSSVSGSNSNSCPSGEGLALKISSVSGDSDISCK